MKYIIAISIIILTSCNKQVTTAFEITNNSGIKIDSLKIEPMVVSTGKFISLKPNEKADYKVDMTGIAKVDGSYRLSYKQNGETIIRNFGYYSNGYPSDNLTRIEIEKDTLKFDTEFEKY